MRTQTLPPTEIAGAIDDPLDLHMQRLGVAKRSTWSRLSSHATLLLLTGVALGPQGLAVLTPAVIDILRPAVPVVLAVLGVTAVFGSTEHDVFSRWGRHLSSSLILVAGLAMALHHDAALEAIAVVGQAACIAVLLAAAGWMLSSRGAGDEERRVFSLAIFLLLGGVADYLSVSGLLLGWIAATAWRLVRAREPVEVRLGAGYVQPMTALLFITAGARVQLSWQVVAIAAAACCVVIAAVLILFRRRPAHTLAFGGLPLTPATFAVALAMDAARLDPQLTTLLSAVVLATAALDLFSDRGTEDAA